MIAPESPCSRDRLQQLLSGQLTDAVAEHVTEHVEHCSNCRSDLEMLAAADSWWQDARCFLTDDGSDLPVEVAGTNSPTCSPETDIADVAPQYLIAGYLEPSEDPNALGRLDDYDILSVIGCGGMGIVMQGLDRQLNRHVAIKALAPHFATSGAARRRFAREAQAAAAVVHPHVLAIHGVSAGSVLPYLVMPLVMGQSLQERIDQQGPLDIKDVLRIGMQAAEGLAAAHNQGLVHRDVKPANILLENGVERVLLTDFGLARAIDDASLTRSGVIAGTPQYMSPEQARGDTIDYRTDLFSLGSVLYTMCAGRPPFRAETTMGVLRRICDSTPRPLQEVNPDVPDWLAAVIDRLLAKDPENRYPSAEAVAVLLEQCLAHVQHPEAMPLPDSVPRVDRPRRRPKRRHVSIATAVLIAMAVLLIGNPLQWITDAQTDDGKAVDRQDVSKPEGMHVSPISKQNTEGMQPESLETVPSWEDGIDRELFEIEFDLLQLDENSEF